MSGLRVIRRGRLWTLLCLWVLACRLAPGAELTNAIRQVAPGSFEIGQVRLETKDRSISLPATVNMVEGPIEYLLVSAIGKLHESVFKTTAEPIHVHTAALLLLKEPISSNAPPQVRISIRVPGKEMRAEESIDNTAVEKRLTAGVWRYNGSRLADGTFIAQRDGSIVSIIADPDALIESGRVSAEDDENWRPRKAQLPPVGTAVTVTFTFEPAKPK